MCDAQAELREYRALQGELAPWTSAFLNKHARKPRLADVEGTGAAPLLKVMRVCSTVAGRGASMRLRAAKRSALCLVADFSFTAPAVSLETRHAPLCSINHERSEVSLFVFSSSVTFARPPGCQRASGGVAGIPWLVCRFKQYVMLRERLLTDTQGLRSRLGGVQLHPPSSPNTGGASRQHHLGQEPVRV